MNINCEECGEEFVKCSGGRSTYAGYISPSGHDHDDNCRNQYYICSNGHRTNISIINRCMTPGCDWVGKTECNVCGGLKVDEWPTIWGLGL